MGRHRCWMLWHMLGILLPDCVWQSLGGLCSVTLTIFWSFGCVCAWVSSWWKQWRESYSQRWGHTIQADITISWSLLLLPNYRFSYGLATLLLIGFSKLPAFFVVARNNSVYSWFLECYRHFGSYFIIWLLYFIHYIHMLTSICFQILTITKFSINDFFCWWRILVENVILSSKWESLNRFSSLEMYWWKRCSGNQPKKENDT